MVDDFEKVALDCLSNSFLRKAGLVVIDEVEKPSMLILHMPGLRKVKSFVLSDRASLEVHREVQRPVTEDLQRLGG